MTQMILCNRVSLSVCRVIFYGLSTRMSPCLLRVPVSNVFAGRRMSSGSVSLSPPIPGTLGASCLVSSSSLRGGDKWTRAKKMIMSEQQESESEIYTVADVERIEAALEELWRQGREQ